MIDDADTGLVNGLAVLDTMLVEDGTAYDMNLHFARLHRDCRTVLRVEAPEFENRAREMIAGVTGTARLRIVITAGIVATPLAIPTQPQIVMSVTATDIPSRPLACKIIKAYPRVAGCVLETCKRTDYTRSFAARQDALSAGFDDAILTNTDGNIACASTSNIFIYEGDTLITPPLKDGVLAGITRHKLVAKGAVESEISVGRLMNADAVFLSNSITGPRSVSVVDGVKFDLRLPDKA